MVGSNGLKITAVILMVMSLTVCPGCKAKNRKETKSEKVTDVWSKPNFIDTDSVYIFADYEDQFSAVETEVNSMYSEIREYNEQQKTQVVKEIGTLLKNHFEDGGSKDEIDDALTVYKDALILLTISSDVSNTYCQIGTIARDAIKVFYMGYGDEELDGKVFVQDCEYLISSMDIEY